MNLEMRCTHFWGTDVQRQCQINWTLRSWAWTLWDQQVLPSPLAISSAASSLSLSPCAQVRVRIRNSTVLAWKCGSYHWRREVFSALPERVPLISLKGSLRKLQRMQHRLRLRVFKSHFHFVINMCEYWISLFPLWFYDYGRLFKSKLKKSLIAWVCFVILNL